LSFFFNAVIVHFGVPHSPVPPRRHSSVPFRDFFGCSHHPRPCLSFTCSHVRWPRLSLLWPIFLFPSRIFFFDSSPCPIKRPPPGIVRLPPFCLASPWFSRRVFSFTENILFRSAERCRLGLLWKCFPLDPQVSPTERRVVRRTCANQEGQPLPFLCAEPLLESELPDRPERPGPPPPSLAFTTGFPRFVRWHLVFQLAVFTDHRPALHGRLTPPPSRPSPFLKAPLNGESTFCQMSGFFFHCGTLPSVVLTHDRFSAMRLRDDFCRPTSFVPGQREFPSILPLSFGCRRSFSRKVRSPPSPCPRPCRVRKFAFPTTIAHQLLQCVEAKVPPLLLEPRPLYETRLLSICAHSSSLQGTWER